MLFVFPTAFAFRLYETIHLVLGKSFGEVDVTLAYACFPWRFR